MLYNLLKEIELLYRKIKGSYKSYKDIPIVTNALSTMLQLLRKELEEAS